MHHQLSEWVSAWGSCQCKPDSCHFHVLTKSSRKKSATVEYTKNTSRLCCHCVSWHCFGNIMPFKNSSTEVCFQPGHLWTIVMMRTQLVIYSYTTVKMKCKMRDQCMENSHFDSECTKYLGLTKNMSPSSDYVVALLESAHLFATFLTWAASIVGITP